MRALEALRANERDLYQEYMGFPEDLPDLRTKLAPGNTKPEGALNCYFALRERGEFTSDVLKVLEISEISACALWYHPPCEIVERGCVKFQASQ